MGILWAHTGAIGCVVLSMWYQRYLPDAIAVCIPPTVFTDTCNLFSLPQRCVLILEQSVLVRLEDIPLGRNNEQGSCCHVIVTVISVGVYILVMVISSEACAHHEFITIVHYGLLRVME